MNRDRLVDTFCELVKIPSVSPDDKEFISYLEKLFKKEGAKTVIDSFGNLIAKFGARNSNSKESIIFACHADTVKPGVGIEPVVENGIIKSKGDTILAADDKAGIAEIIEMLRSAKKYPPLEIVITRCEEIGTLGSTKLDYSLLDSKIGYVLDMDVPDEIVVGGPTKIAFYIDYRGKSAHASEPENGISSIQPAARAISQLKLGKLDEESTANVGILEGGDVTNSIPEKTRVVAECRSLNHEKALAISEEMKSIFNKASQEFGTEINIKEEMKYKAYLIPSDSRVVKLATGALNKHGIKEDIKVVTGGTDATNFNNNGIQATVLGVGCREIHTTDEYAIIGEMEITTKIITSIVEDLA